MDAHIMRMKCTWLKMLFVGAQSHLVDVVFSREQGAASQEFCKYAPQRPHVHARPVLARAVQQLGGAVPPNKEQSEFKISGFRDWVGVWVSRKSTRRLSMETG